MSTYSQMYIHNIFAVKNRTALIHPIWEERLYQYITGIVQSYGHKMLAINGTQNHIHIFINIKPNCNISDLAREIKKASNKMINENKLTSLNFHWQDGFGAFSYSHSQIDNVIQYVKNQKEHHKKKQSKKNIWICCKK